jgi:hypothetical protein
MPPTTATVCGLTSRLLFSPTGTSAATMCELFAARLRAGMLGT